jgi:hypothetical protein
MGLTFQTSPATDTGKGSFFGRLDFQNFGPLWVSVRARVAPVTEVDTLVGVRLSHHYGLEDEVQQRQIAETATTRTYLRTSEEVFARSDVVLVGGFKSTSVIMPQSMNGQPGEKRTDAFKILMGGLQWHTATTYGSHRIIELYGMYNPGTDKMGLSALWHNSLHLQLSSRLVFGMEAGWVPASSGTIIYWSIVDLGFAFSL